MTATKPAPRQDAAANAPRAGVTPAMAQFLNLKEAHPGYLLFYRMGDFYELFFEDAVTASEALGITLTKRGKHAGEDVPMCGVPVHAAESYLEQLIRKGHKVAVCEQMEDPAAAKARGAKAVVARDVVRLVTPGTLTEDTLLEAKANNFLAALASAGKLSEIEAPADLSLAWIDISTGEFSIAPTSPDRLGADLAQLAPAELLVPDRLLENAALDWVLKGQETTLTVQPAIRFDSLSGERRLRTLFDVETLEAFGRFGRADLGAAGALIDYIEATQKGALPVLRPPSAQADGDAMHIDAATRANLEITKTLSGARTGSLLAALDRTLTNAGARLFARRLAAPARHLDEIAGRHEAVEFLLDRERLMAKLAEALKAAPDLGRALSRLSLSRGGPRDLLAIKTGLSAGGGVAELLAAARQEATDLGGKEPLGELAEAETALIGTRETYELSGELALALNEDPPALVRDGNFIAPGYSDALDECRRLRDESRQVLAALEATYKDRTGIASLKIKHNNVLGYFIEVTATHADKILSKEHSHEFHHRQTLVSGVRVTTADLNDLAAKIEAAGVRALDLEAELFNRLLERTLSVADDIHEVAEGLAVADVSLSAAKLAREASFVRPQMSDDLSFAIEAGRHPVVEQALRQRGEDAFIPNACDLSGDDGNAGGKLWLVTGPNMAGKSTFLRQNALIAIMAQAGCFVPAARAKIGLVDRVFSRVGASDDLARGRSTFMVEMVETAAILNQATERSLVILDEIGRGTATYDGLAIAWATLEHLHNVVRARGLFATHYHELTALESKCERLAPVTVRVREWKGKVVFLHEVVPGTADRSYGVQVARLAGLPQAVIARASEVLKQLEANGPAAGLAPRIDDLPLFASRPDPVEAAKETDEAEADLFGELKELDIDGLSPREALETLYGLKARALEKNSDE